MVPLVRRSVVSVVVAFVGVAAAILSPGSAGAGGGACHQVPEPAEGAGLEVAMTHSCFVPMVLRIQPGAAVTFTNTDPMVHYVTGAGNAWGTQYNEEGIVTGQRLIATFDEAGTYAYSCSLHPGMTGVVVVGDGTFAGSPRSPESGLVALRAEPPGAQSEPAPQPVAAAVSTSDHSSITRSVLLGGVGALAGAVAVAAVMSARQRG